MSYKRSFRMAPPMQSLGTSQLHNRWLLQILFPCTQGHFTITSMMSHCPWFGPCTRRLCEKALVSLWWGPESQVPYCADSNHYTDSTFSFLSQPVQFKLPFGLGICLLTLTPFLLQSSKWFFSLFYSLFICSCAGSLLPRGFFSTCSAQASHCDASLVVERGL